MGQLLMLEFLLLLQILAPSLISGESAAQHQLNMWASTHPNESTPFAASVGGISVPSLSGSLAVVNQYKEAHILLMDQFLISEMAEFNRERIPERVVHAKGAGAFGSFVVTHDISQYTKADFLNEIGKSTDVVVRFSTVGGELGSADTWIDPKGFATKFYTKAGVHDLVGNNLEVFPIRDPALFADINRSRKRNPQTHLRDPNHWWDFTSLRPEAALHTLHLFSDLGTPNGFPSMDGAGVHTYKMVNAKGEAVYVKFHWLSNQKKKALTREESAALAGTNSDYLIQDLYDAITRNDSPSWNMSIQVMTFEQAKAHPQNPFDITKHWRREEYPLIPVGTMTLDRNPTDYFTQVEQAAFSPSHMVAGIEPSPDRMLQARMFSYPDSQRYRLGINAAQLPVNRCPFEFETYQRDGAMNFGKNGGGGPNYFPNSFHGAKQSLDAREPPFAISGDVDRKDVGDEDNFVMAKMFWEKDLDDAGRKRVVEDIADFLGKAEKSVQGQFLQNVAFPIDKEFGTRLEVALNKDAVAPVIL